MFAQKLGQSRTSLVTLQHLTFTVIAPGKRLFSHIHHSEVMFMHHHMLTVCFNPI